jgi:RNA polymerase sigma-70 factor (ECF subfamily)
VIDPVVRAAQDGDAAAFACLYDLHASRLFALALGLTSDRQMAEELVQDTFVRAWERLRTFRGDCAFPTWLHRVAVNVLLVNERSRKRRALRVAIASDLADGHDGAPPTLDAPMRATDVGLSMDLESAVSRLPAGARAVFVLHDIGGYAHAEIANQLGIAEGTSKAHLFRARRLLRGMLDR